MESEYFVVHKSPVPSQDPDQKVRIFFIGIIYDGGEDGLSKTFESISRQNYPASQIDLRVFYKTGNAPGINFHQPVQLVPFQSEKEFFQKFISNINDSKADYYLTFRSGECFFDYSLEVISKTFHKQPEISWITGIQTIQVSNGFNVIFGSMATRRWSYGIFERNLYKKSARYIPAGSTFWKRSLWDKAQPYLYFVLYKSFSEDLWLAFFKVAQLYTSNIYISSTTNYDAEKMTAASKSIQYSLLEDSFMQKMQEFFFVNNVPYLRLYYRKKNKLVPVVRYDFRMQSCFLNDY